MSFVLSIPIPILIPRFQCRGLQMAVIFAAAVWKRVYLTLSINNVVRTSDPLRVGLIGLFFNSLSFI